MVAACLKNKAKGHYVHHYVGPEGEEGPMMPLVLGDRQPSGFHNDLERVWKLRKHCTARYDVSHV